MFGDDLKKARRRFVGLTQEKLSQAIAGATGESLTRQAVQRWEANEVLPESEKWEAIEKVLDLPVGWVYSAIDRDKKAMSTILPTSPATISSPRATITGSSDIAISSNGSQSASGNSTITMRSDVDLEPKIETNLTPKEYQAVLALRGIGEKGIEAVILFERFGNNFLLDQCLKKLIKQRDEWVNLPISE